eukprot:g80861.t1
MGISSSAGSPRIKRGFTRQLKNEHICQYYKLQSGVLGIGAIGVVKKATRISDGEQFAVKIIDKKQLQTREMVNLQREVDVMLQINHPHCVRLFEVFESETCMFLVMELVSGGELFTQINSQSNFSEADAAKIISQVADVLVYLHSQGIVHRDLKPENILCAAHDWREIKITDFGVSTVLAGSRQLRSVEGTPSYVAPEVLNRQPYGSEVDCWSTGVILYILLSGSAPFKAEGDTSELYRLIKAGNLQFPAKDWKDISQEAVSLVKGLLTVDPRARLTAAQILEHEWVQNHATSTKNLDTQRRTNLQLFLGRRALRRTVAKIMCANRFKDAADRILEEQISRFNSTESDLENSLPILRLSQMRTSDPEVEPKMLDTSDLSLSRPTSSESVSNAFKFVKDRFRNSITRNSLSSPDNKKPFRRRVSGTVLRALAIEGMGLDSPDVTPQCKWDFAEENLSMSRLTEDDVLTAQDSTTAVPDWTALTATPVAFTFHTPHIPHNSPEQVLLTKPDRTSPPVAFRFPIPPDNPPLL